MTQEENYFYSTYNYKVLHSSITDFISNRASPLNQNNYVFTGKQKITDTLNILNQNKFGAVHRAGGLNDKSWLIQTSVFSPINDEDSLASYSKLRNSEFEASRLRRPFYIGTAETSKESQKQSQSPVINTTLRLKKFESLMNEDSIQKHIHSSSFSSYKEQQKKLSGPQHLSKLQLKTNSYFKDRQNNYQNATQQISYGIDDFDDENLHSLTLYNNSFSIDETKQKYKVELETKEEKTKSEMPDLIIQDFKQNFSKQTGNFELGKKK